MLKINFLINKENDRNLIPTSIFHIIAVGEETFPGILAEISFPYLNNSCETSDKNC